MSGESWFLFDLLGLSSEQEWMQAPVDVWEVFEDYRKLKEFVTTVSVTNDLAERGIKLMSDFISMSKDEEQLQALLQVVEHHRKRFPNYKKESLANFAQI